VWSDKAVLTTPLQYLFHYHSILVALLVLTTVMGVILVGFTIYHLYLIGNNTTTNETFKWRTLEYNIEEFHALKARLASQVRHCVVRAGAADVAHSSGVCLLRVLPCLALPLSLTPSQKRAFLATSSKDGAAPVLPPHVVEEEARLAQIRLPSHVPPNSYDRGRKANFLEVCFSLLPSLFSLLSALVSLLSSLAPCLFPHGYRLQSCVLPVAGVVPSVA
jgi:hypothetical protein